MILARSFIKRCTDEERALLPVTRPGLYPSAPGFLSATGPELYPGSLALSLREVCDLASDKGRVCVAPSSECYSRFLPLGVLKEIASVLRYSESDI